MRGSPPPGRNPEVDFKGQERSNDTHESTTDADARLYSAVDGRIRRHKGYQSSLKVRKRIEEAFGWIKTMGGLAKTKLIGHAKLAGQALLCFATYNLVRMGSLGGWWDPHIMREYVDRCARKGQDGLKTGIGEAEIAAQTPLSCQKRGHRGMQRV